MRVESGRDIKANNRWPGPNPIQCTCSVAFTFKTAALAPASSSFTTLSELPLACCSSNTASPTNAAPSDSIGAQARSRPFPASHTYVSFERPFPASHKPRISPSPSSLTPRSSPVGAPALVEVLPLCRSRISTGAS
jgi:hypothetical protein